MKPFLPLLITALLTLLTLGLAAEPIQDFLFPPELLVQAQAEVPLTEEQKQHLQEVTDKMEARFRELQEQLQKENDALAAIVKPARVDPAAALEQLKKILAIDNSVRQTQLGFMLAIKAVLTPEQQEKLTAFRKAQFAARAEHEETQNRLLTKAKQVREGVDKIVTSGGDTRPVAALMEEAQKLMQQGKAKEAEAVVDRAVKMLGGDERAK